MMNQGLILSILALAGLTAALQAHESNKKKTVENFAGLNYPMTFRINREVSIPQCDGRNKMFSVSGNYQSSLSPRFSNVNGYGSRIRYRKPCREAMGVPEHPLTYYKNCADSCNPCHTTMAGDPNNPCRPRFDQYGCRLMDDCDLSRTDVEDPCGAKRCPQSATLAHMLPVTDMRTVHAMTAVQTPENQRDINNALDCSGCPSSICEESPQPVVYDRLIYANARSRLRGRGDYIRGDLPIVPVHPESNPQSLIMFRPSVSEHIDLNQGALNVLGGYDNVTQKQLQNLMARSSNGCVGTFSGSPINNSTVTCNSASDVIVSSFL
jgi:Family of unknown function (DUF5850)